MMGRSQIAERLAEARELAGFASAREAALALGFAESTYNQHENGTRGIKMDVARRYADAFDVPVEWLLHGTGGEFIGGSKYQNLRTNYEENPDVEPFVPHDPKGRSLIRQIAKVMCPHSDRQAYLLARRTRSDLLVARGDVLVLELTNELIEGDTVLVQVLDDKGLAEAQLRLFVGGLLIGAPDVEKRALPPDPGQVNVRGRVVASLRGLHTA
ncbi:helix-turn-helix domain-containing protein [Roseicyclus marinus]|uniref:helix-turn-helix domain-containing protein n=1 Tax=Roseicyclus marinus TaxID=2161673 RepID=UPI00240ED01C|nr:helix-turn-helix transcriptional regulator [Roseicyclus marinus]MDG3040460.1 helix-turn-helix transcriptional regulator [Roseicyclus marinus]